VGEPGLLATLRDPALEPVTRHLSRQSTLTGLTRDEVGSYVFHRLGVAGNPHIDLEEGALGHVYEVSRGIPRRVNLVCDRALAEGQRLAVSVIDQPIIHAAAKSVGLSAPSSKSAYLNRDVLVALTLTMLAIGGAALAGYLFQDEVASLILRWK
jgi:general secretion pathway protein A